ncbi:MAG TPA: hypothetical protein PKZ01_07415, partial [Candidatus Hydrogenedentes bacterium]|nr:hypothetical protein [Candidatus Hydrogenedentota bacterium]
MKFLRRHKILSFLFVVLLLVVSVILYRMKGPYRSYRIDLVKPAPDGIAQPGMLEVGVAKRDITPDLSQYDTWTDIDGDGAFRPDKGDTYEDRNHNGTFDLVWIAGFDENRPAQGVHDPLWVRAIAFRNNGVTVAMVTIDSIGILEEPYIRIRKSLDPALKIDHVMFSCTHTHEGPDTTGIWSYSLLRPRFDAAYMALVERACKQAVEEAVRTAQPAVMHLTSTRLEPGAYSNDTRKPLVYDETLCLARFIKPDTDETIATMMDRHLANLERVCNDPTVKASADLTDMDRKRLAGISYGPERPEFTHKTTPALVAKRVAMHPDRQAVGSGGGHLTYQNLADR